MAILAVNAGSSTLKFALHPLQGTQVLPCVLSGTIQGLEPNGRPEMAWREGTAPEDREHVTPWLRRAPGIRRAVLAGPGGDLIHQRWTLDFPEDYEFFKAVFALLPSKPAISDWKAILQLLSTNLYLEKINSSCNQR